jgi:hypothetical protein
MNMCCKFVRKPAVVHLMRNNRLTLCGRTVQLPTASCTWEPTKDKANCPNCARTVTGQKRRQG